MKPRDGISHVQAISALYKEQYVECDQHVVSRRRQVLSTTDRRLLHVAVYTALAGAWSWPNYLSPQFGTKFHRYTSYPHFRRYPNFPNIQCSMGRVRQKSTKSVQSCRYNTGVWQTDRQTDTTSANTRASIASRGLKRNHRRNEQHAAVQ